MIIPGEFRNNFDIFEIKSESNKFIFRFELKFCSDSLIESSRRCDQIDYILYGLSMDERNRQVAAFGKVRMQLEVQKLQRFSTSCKNLEAAPNQNSQR